MMEFLQCSACNSAIKRTHHRSRFRFYLCNFIKKDSNTECFLCGFCTVASFKLPKHFQKHFLTKWQVPTTTTCLTKIYETFNTKGNLHCVKTTFAFECRCRCRCRDADAEISKWPLLRLKKKSVKSYSK